MTIPSEIETLIDRLNQQLDEIEEEATEGVNVLRRVISQFPENAILVQYFAYLNSLLFFAESSRRQIATIVEQLSPSGVRIEIIQEAGEDLGTLVGQLAEAQLRLARILNFLRSLP